MPVNLNHLADETDMFPFLKADIEAKLVKLEDLFYIEWTIPINCYRKLFYIVSQSDD